MVKLPGIAYPKEQPVWWAFWPYDSYPYLLSGEVGSFENEGKVTVKGYSGMVFKPVYLTQGDYGLKLHLLVRKLRAAYSIHHESAVNAAQTVGRAMLLEAGMPEGAVMKENTGWQGAAYQQLFRQQLGMERDV